MADKQQVVCEACNERNATSYLCEPGTGVSKHLCQVCFERQVPQDLMDSERNLVNAIQNGRCKYCGEPAIGGSGGSIPFLGDQIEIWCEQCRQDLVEFLSKPENELTEFPFDDEVALQQVLQQMTEHQRRQKEFMERKVSERRRQNAG